MIFLSKLTLAILLKFYNKIYFLSLTEEQLPCIKERAQLKTSKCQCQQQTTDDKCDAEEFQNFMYKILVGWKQIIPTLTSNKSVSKKANSFIDEMLKNLQQC